MFHNHVMSEIIKVAVRHAFNPAALLAVADVESAGRAYWNIDGVKWCPLRFEGHWFRKRLSGEKLAEATSAGLTSSKSGNSRTFKGAVEVFQKALAIDAKAAIESTSFGCGQVMGGHWKMLGYKSPQVMFDDAMSGVEGQVRMMVKFIVHEGLKKFIDKCQWDKFAFRYNGRGYKKNRYAIKMAAAFKRYLKSAGNFDKSKALGLLQVEKDLAVLGFCRAPLILAIKDFQMEYGLVVDGDAGPMTARKISELLSERATRKSKINIPAVVGGGVAISTQAQPVIEAVSKASDVANGARSVIDSIGMTGAVAGIVIACVVAFVVYRQLQNVSDDGALS